MSQFKTSVILCIQNFAKNDTENAELASKMLRQQHFLHQRKNLYTKNLYEVFQARQTQMIITGIPDGSFSFTHPSPYFIRGGRGAAWTETGWGRFAPPRGRPSKPAPPGCRLPRHNKWGKKRDCVEEKCRVRKHLQEFVEILGCSLSVLWIKSTLSER